MAIKSTIRVLSLGWGVQSFTIAAMIALGKIKPVDFAVHSDTGHETMATYQFAERWSEWLERHGVRIDTIRPANNDILIHRASGTAVSIPAFTKSASGRGILRRQCTLGWKIRPIRRHLQVQRNGKRVELIQGISVDEANRARISDVKYISNTYPLIDMNITRQDCIDWMNDHNIEVPERSSCYMCPYHSKKDWVALSKTPDWDKILEVDKMIRFARPGEMGYHLYLHNSLRPIDELVEEWR